MPRPTAAVLVALALLTAGCGSGGGDSAPAPTLPSDLARVDRGASGLGGDGVEGSGLRLSADGRYAVFASSAADLITLPTGGQSQIYRKDRLTGELVLVSRAWGAADRPAGNGSSSSPAISADGRVVVFASFATNLVAGDGNAKRDIFAVDLGAGTIVGVSRNVTGSAFGNDHSDYPDVSGDGRMVAFESAATDLVFSDGNASTDVFRRELATGLTVRASVEGFSTEKTGASQFARINRDGNLIAFQSMAAFKSTDTNGVLDVYLRRLDAATTTRISVGHTVDNTNGPSYAPEISADGESVVFLSDATDIVTGDTNAATDVFVKSSVVVERVSLTDSEAQIAGGSYNYPDISGDGRWVVFASTAAIDPLDTHAGWDVYVRDRSAGRTRLVPRTAAGVLNDGDNYGATIASDASTIGFQAMGTTLPGAEAATFHVFAGPNVVVGSG